jgi:hypothetical protein
MRFFFSSSSSASSSTLHLIAIILALSSIIILSNALPSSSSSHASASSSIEQQQGPLDISWNSKEEGDDDQRSNNAKGKRSFNLPGDHVLSLTPSGMLSISKISTTSDASDSSSSSSTFETPLLSSSSSSNHHQFLSVRGVYFSVREKDGNFAESVTADAESLFQTTTQTVTSVDANATHVSLHGTLLAVPPGNTKRRKKIAEAEEEEPVQLKYSLTFFTSSSSSSTTGEKEEQEEELAAALHFTAVIAPHPDAEAFNAVNGTYYPMTRIAFAAHHDEAFSGLGVQFSHVNFAGNG